MAVTPSCPERLCPFEQAAHCLQGLWPPVSTQDAASHFNCQRPRLAVGFFLQKSFRERDTINPVEPAHG